MDLPLVFTTQGNMLETDLVYSKSWEFMPEAIKFKETYTFNDIIVKESVHIFVLQGQDVGSILGVF